jgi:hypothetical protein
MIEREPTFEDDNIRTWTFAPRDREPSRFEGDPTLMQVDVEREEIYESRTYRFQATPEVLGFLVDVVAARLPAPGLSLEQLCDFAMSLIEDTTYKFLAKRDKEDGSITATLIVVGGGERSLLLQQEHVDEAEFRQAVHAFETGYLPSGVLSPPLVVPLEEWRRYAQEGPFPEESLS